jgi:predicted class III extradiol MEMO1 family dioxygenase
VPVLGGDARAGEAAALAAAIRPLLDAGTLLVASSDLVHYGRRHGFVPVPPTDAESVRAAVRAFG